MKKLLALFAAVALTVALSACGKSLPEEITMANVDEVLGMENVQYVDLRDLDNKLADGYIQGFTFIPFFDYLEVEEIANRDGEALDADRLKELFDMDAEAILLMCQSGGRAGWVKSALEAAGFTNVHNIGGFKDYEGDNLVPGDGTYKISVAPYGDLTPGVYVGGSTPNDDGDFYMVVVTVSPNGGISNVYVDGTKRGSTKQLLGADYGMANADGNVAGEWNVQAQNLADAIVANNGWDTEWVWNDTDEVYDGLAGVTIGLDDIKAAYDAAIALATPAS